MTPQTHVVACRYFCVLLILFAFICRGNGQSRKQSELVLNEDLQRFGYTFDPKPDVLFIETDLAFLSNDLILVSARDVPGKTLSTVLLFNVKEQKLAKSIDLPVRSVENAVVPIQDSRFLMLSDRGWQICSVEFMCGEPWPSAWPIFVSPDGSRATIGDVAEQRWVELNPKYSSLQESWKNGTVTTHEMVQPPDQGSHGPRIELRIRKLPSAWKSIAGETGWLFEKRNTTFVQVPGKQEVDLGISGNARFVDSARVIGIKEGKATMVTIEGTVAYQVPGRLHATSHFITSASGQRFGIYELGYRGMSSWIDFGEENGAYNLARMRVFDVATGHQLFNLKWDPGRDSSYAIKPVISPDGHRVALVIHDQLRVYQIP